ncbi:MAG: hypothetical protein QME66_04780 [Candidatus Eisenbacteria bacterium]|nr:hypothetical protein [Candidatus Eisenbacteria bacterium]
MRIKKVKVTGEDRVHIAYETMNNGQWDEFSLTCAQKAAPGFYEALKDLVPHVVEICELPKEYSSRIAVQGVSASYAGEKEVMGATILAALLLDHSNCNLNLNTPYKISESYSDGPGDEKQLMTDECCKALEELYEECEKYIRGLRVQIELFAGDPRKSQKAAASTGKKKSKRLCHPTPLRRLC